MAFLNKPFARNALATLLINILNLPEAFKMCIRRNVKSWSLDHTNVG